MPTGLDGRANNAHAAAMAPLSASRNNTTFPGPLTEHAADIGGAGTPAANLENIHALGARDQVAEGQRAQQVANDRGDEEGYEHGANLQLHKFREFDGAVRL